MAWDCPLANFFQGSIRTLIFTRCRLGAGF